LTIDENKSALIAPFYPITLHEYVTSARFNLDAIPTVVPVNVALCGIRTICSFNAVGRAHCDLKPQNMCLGDDKIIVAIDYGSSLRVGEDVAHTTQYWYPGITDWRASSSFDFHALGTIVLSMVVNKRTFDNTITKNLESLDEFVSSMSECVDLKNVAASIGLFLLTASSLRITSDEVWNEVRSMVEKDIIISDPELVNFESICPN